MDQGRVVDEGTHNDLLARGGLYADLYRRQFRDGKTVSEKKHRVGKAASTPKRAGPKTSFFARLFKRAC